jgi:mannosyltransferase
MTTRLITLALVALGFALRLYKLGSESLWYDELLQLDIARKPLALFPGQLPKYSALPLDYVISHFWILLGHSEFWVRIPAVVVGTLTLPVAYQLGRKLLGRTEGLLLMAFVTISPFHVYYSQEVRPYGLLMLGVMLFGYAFWRLREAECWRDIVALQLGALLFGLTHFFGNALFMPVVGFAMIDVVGNNRRKASFRRVVILLISGFIILLIILGLGWGKTLFYTSREYGKAIVIQPAKFTVEASQKPNGGTGPQVNWPFFRSQILAPMGVRGSPFGFWLFNGLAVVGLLYLVLQQRYKLSLLLCLWLILPVVLVVSFLVYRGTFFASRYVSSILPVYLLLAATGVLAIPRWLRSIAPRWVAAGVLILLAGGVLWHLGRDLERIYRFKDKEDWRLVGRFLAQNAGPDDAVIAANAEATLNWYYPPATAQTDTYDKLESIQSTAAQAHRSWVIISPFTDYLLDSGKIEAWLSEQGAIRLRLDPAISVYYFGQGVDPDQLLREIQGFALPADPALYASLARENRHHPAVARQYYQLAIEYAPDDLSRAAYQAALDALMP